MSSTGQVVGGIVGAVVGFFTPIGPIYGAQIGMMVGGLIDPPKGPDGPRLNDLTVQTATYGAFISRNHGTIGQAGNVFWLKGDKLTERKSKQSGKGGSESTVYNYSATFAVGLCQGPISGVRRIWVGADLVYDVTAGDVVSTDGAGLWTLYTGTDTQLADPLMQADKGIANVPAYRGLAYIVFEDMPLEKHSNSLMAAQVKVEIVKDGTLSRPNAENTVGPGFYAAVYDAPTGLLMYHQRWLTIHVYDLASRTAIRTIDTTAQGNVWTIYAGPPGQLWAAGQYNWYVYDIATGANIQTVPHISEDHVKWNQYDYSMVGYKVASVTHYTGGLAQGIWTRVAYTPIAGVIWQSIEVTSRGHIVLYSDYSKRVAVLDSSFNLLLNYTVSVGGSFTWNGTTTYDSKRNRVYICVSDNTTILTVDLNNYYSPTVTPSTAGVAGGKWPLYHEQVDLVIVTGFGADPFIWVYDPENLITPIDTFGGSGFWPSTYRTGWAIEVPGWSDRVLHYGGDAGISVFQFGKRINPNSPLLSEVVKAECLTSNLLTAADLNVAELTDTVRGYRITSKNPIRNSIEPLRASWPFDVVQDGYKIKFKKRGSASIATIPASDLDAREAGSQPGVQITDSREMDLMLPRQLSIKYLDSAREYDVNEQSESRINTDAVNVSVVDLAIVLLADEAKQKVATLLYLSWLERYDIAFVLPPTYQHLQPADVVNIAAVNATYNLRLTSVSYLSDGRVECKAKYNSAAIYTQISVADKGLSVGAALALSGASVYELLDIPLLRDDDNTAGFPMAMSSYWAGWPGGILHRSDDRGQTWADIVAVPSPGSVIGSALNALTAHTGTVLDKASTLSVRLYSGALSSVSEAQTFVGQNWFAYGVNGRWEIIAAQTCVLQGNGSYILSGFMRGQKGSEWATGLHAAGDKLVLLDAAKLDFISVNAATIGASRDYRAITVGKGIDTDISRAFAYTGVNLECLSPVHLTGNRHPTTNDWTLTWVRRGRLDSWRDLVDLPLGETTESYEIEVFSSNTFATLRRTLTSATPTVVYTSANQVTDAGSNQATIHLRIFQLSATVGRGYPLQISITR